MYTEYTWQDWQNTPEMSRPAMVESAIRTYKASKDFADGLTANIYFRGENTEVNKKTVLRAKAVQYKDPATGRVRKKSDTEDVVGNRIPSAFFFRFVTQQNQHLLSNGVTLEDESTKNALGRDFDKQLERLGERSLLHGVAWGFWNGDHMEVIEAVKDAMSGAVALVDEETSEPMVLIQFWQINAERPMYARVFTPDGVVKYRYAKGGMQEIENSRRAYIVKTRTDALGTEIIGQSNYGRLPVIPLYASEERRSELTQAIKSKIDLYDRILSDFGDNLDRANDVYWVLNNFGGTFDEVVELLEQINKIKAVTSITDGSGNSMASAEPHTIAVPYEARKEALDLLERALYQDYMALDMDALTGGSLTNVAIRAATANLELKADRYEWQVRKFVQNLLNLLGKDVDEIRFKRQTIANESEVVADISLMRADIDRRTALKLNPYVDDEEIEAIMRDMDAEEVSGKPSMEELDKMLAAARQVSQE